MKQGNGIGQRGGKPVDGVPRDFGIGSSEVQAETFSELSWRERFWPLEAQMAQKPEHVLYCVCLLHPQQTLLIDCSFLIPNGEQLSPARWSGL